MHFNVNFLLFFNTHCLIAPCIDCNVAVLMHVATLAISVCLSFLFRHKPLIRTPLIHTGLWTYVNCLV